MRRRQIYLIAVLLSAIIILFVFQYLFSIYEVEIRTDNYILYADNKSECVIQAIPLNSFGMKIPFRKASAKIELEQGADLIEVIELDQENGRIRIRAKHRTGLITINIKPEKSLLPTSVEIKIEPSVT